MKNLLKICLLLLTVNSFGQYSKKELRKIKRLTRKFDFVLPKNSHFSSPNCKGDIVVGDYFRDLLMVEVDLLWVLKILEK